ncbi:PilN domain-containing protein [Tenuibacillus multivorans]|uniref:Tfp pilus assembly protein PilN n=1 Tax=Tenuibacillus multivorans TaxID=237069 RepID=A0A1H0FZ63_9BACI|nr:PilN domain-containing protein [Tenuibacillus multivorans]GEL78148.1 hypothetical protein TMU01_23830 [Tenuibacillus multivorans]SDN99933.1 Tfp pilus assembly protein PilN [Tenuibacillus multivorans]
MLVDINLLPKRPKKNYSSIILYTLLSGITIIIIGCGTMMFWTNAQTVERVEEHVNQQKKINAVLQSKLQGGVEEQRANELQDMIHQLKQNSISISNVMSKILELVPSNSSLDAFQFHEQQIDLTLTSPTNEQAVDFFLQLKSVKTFAEVSIHTINYVETEDHYVTNYTVHLQSTQGKEDE